MAEDLRALLGGERPQSLRSVSLPRGLRVLVLAPHPDDFDAIGIALKYLAKGGHDISLGMVFTGSGVEACYATGMPLSEKAALRTQEQRNSLRFFGLPGQCFTVLHLAMDEEDQPLKNPENCEALASFLEERQADLVFMPHGNDSNAGHRAMFALFGEAARRLSPPPLALLNRDPKTLGMRMDFYMPFGPEEAEWKAALLRCHDSQQQRNLNTRGHGFDARILECNRCIARELSLDAPYAEAFEVDARWTSE